MIDACGERRENGPETKASFSRNNRRQISGPITVSNVEKAANPVSAINVNVDHIATTGDLTFNIAPPPCVIGSVACRPTSAVLSFASPAVCSWAVRAFANGHPVFESRTLVTCGNSITAQFRAPRGTDYGFSTQATSADVSWQIVCSAVGGAVNGTATFGIRGAMIGLLSTPNAGNLSRPVLDGPDLELSNPQPIGNGALASRPFSFGLGPPPPRPEV
jgi:hypothetical protein